MKDHLCANGNRSRTLHSRRHFDSTHRIHRGKGGGAREARNNEEVRDPPLPFPDYAGHSGYVVKATFKCSTLSILPNLVVIADIVLKRKPFVNVFHHHCSSQDIYKSGKKRFKVVIKNFRDADLSMNAKVLFLVICVASAILYVTRHVVIYEVLCVISRTIATQREKKLIRT